MAKRSKKKQGSLQRMLLSIVILVVLVILVQQGIIDEQTLKDLGIDLEGGDTSDVVVEEVPPVSGAFYELYFTQVINSNDEARHHGAAVEQALIRAIDGAQSTIDGALFELNAPDTTAALVRALGRGVQVRLVLDDEHALEDPESTAEEVIAAGAQTRSDERSALMHNKFLIIDSRAVWTGSMNFTRNGIYNNNNNAILIQSQQLAQNYQGEFDEMFLDGVFTRRGDTHPVAARTIQIGDTQIETYFAPEDGDTIEARLAELARGAQQSIRVMAFSFTLDSVGSAMIESLNRGVSVEGVFETTGSLQGQMRPLACAGVDVRQDGNPDILHHKVFIFDNQIVVMGSFNFSASARDDNNENMLIIHNPQIAAAFTAEWQARFNQGHAPSAEDLAC